MSSSPPAKVSAIEALERAQWIAFAPFVFQAAAVLRDRGVLAALLDEPEGMTLAEVVDQVELPNYGVRVLLEAGLGIGLVHEDEAGRYHATNVAYFLEHDDMSRRNFDFTRDVNYRGLAALDAAIATGKPAGLGEFGSWPTIYDGLSELPDEVRRSWFGFDQFYSDTAFPAMLDLVLADGPRRLLDIGGNTGKWARACLEREPSLEITLVDLPGQLHTAEQQLRAASVAEHVELFAANVLDPELELPRGFDAITMSQFLDCFSEAEIVEILRRCVASMGPETRLYILENFWDRQRFAAAQFCLQMTSLYFTALANGNSQIYRSSVFLACIEQAGLVVEKEHDDIGHGHTLLVCRLPTRS